MSDQSPRPNRFWVLLIWTVILTAITASAAWVVRQGDPLPIEIAFSLTLQSRPEHWLPYVMALISVFGYQPWGAIIVILCMIMIGLRIDQKLSIYYGVVAALQGVSNYALKMMIARPRPAEPLVRVYLPADGYSFPSGHVMFYSVCFGLLVCILLRYGTRTVFKVTAIALLVGLTLMVGISRIYLGAHWLMDVLAGYSFGAILLMWAVHIMQNRLSTQKPQPFRLSQGETR